MMKQNKIKSQKVFFSLFTLFFFIMTVAAQSTMTDEDFQKKLNDFKQSGDLKTFTNDFGSLTDAQRLQLIEQIPETKFWEQWTNLDETVKINFAKSLDSAARNAFMKKLSTKYGVEFTGFDKNTGFGVGGVIGNAKTYVDAEQIQEFNKNAKDPIKKIEYKKTGEIDIIKIIKQSGSSLELKVGKDNPGFYFSPQSNRIHSSSGSKNSFVGIWNGNGQLTIDVSSADQSKISLDYTKKDGLPDLTNYATFTRENGESFSTIQKPSGVDEKGNQLYSLSKAELSFDKEGKLKKITDAYTKTATFGGYFGNDVSIFHTLKDFDDIENKATLGSYLLVDKEKRIVKGDVARHLVSQDVASDFRNYKNMIGEAKDYLKNLADSITRLDPEDIRKAMALGTGLREDNPLLPFHSLQNINIAKPLISQAFGYAEFSLSSAENVATKIQSIAESPVFNAPNEGTLLSVHIPNDMAQHLANVDLRGGRLSLEDSSGKLVNIVNLATPYNYYLNPNFNKNNPSLSGINFNLRNTNILDQQIQVYSNNQGKLFAVGVGKTGLETYKSLDVVAAGSVNVQGGLFGIININKPFSQNVGGFEYQTDPKIIQEATDYLTKSTDVDIFRQLREESIAGGFTAAEIKKLETVAGKITHNYYQILTKGDSQFTVYGQELSQVGYRLDQVARTPSQQRNINDYVETDFINRALALSATRVLSDKSVQDQLVQRRLYSEEALIRAGKNQLSEVASFMIRNPSNSLTFVSDSKNKVYQLRSGSRMLNLDPALAPFVKDILPMVVGSGGLNAQGKLYIDPYVFAHNRFLGPTNQRDTFGYYPSYTGLIWASKNKDLIQSEVQTYFQRTIPNHFRTPG